MGSTPPSKSGWVDWCPQKKGCYTGQEVLARLVTYDKVTRQLVQLGAPEPMETKAIVYAEGKAVGQVTTAAVSPQLGPIALAVMRRPFDEAGTHLEIRRKDGLLSATVN